MNRKLRFTSVASEQLDALKNAPASKNVNNQVLKTLGYLETNPHTKSLQPHEYESLTRRYREKVFEAYAQRNTPAAYRVFWHYGPDEINDKGESIPVITIVAITPHPD